MRFLKAGDKVKVTIMFRGREQSRPELGFRLLQRLAEDVVELGFVESAPKQDGRNMVMVLGPPRRRRRVRQREASRRRAAAQARRAEQRRGTDAAPTEQNPSAETTEVRPAGTDAPPVVGDRRIRHVREVTHAAGPRGPARRARRSAHAEDEDAQRRQEAVPRDGLRQGDAPARPPRAQVPGAQLPGRPPPGERRGRRARPTPRRPRRCSVSDRPASGTTAPPPTD